MALVTTVNGDTNIDYSFGNHEKEKQQDSGLQKVQSFSSLDSAMDNLQTVKSKLQDALKSITALDPDLDIVELDRKHYRIDWDGEEYNLIPHKQEKKKRGRKKKV